MAPSTSMHCGDLVAELLMRMEVEFVFGMPGGQTTALHDGIARRAPRIRHVLVRDERSGPYAADAYARLTGKPGVTDVTVGPGTTKIPDGLVEALNASVPMIALVGELPLDWTSLRAKGVASQGFDQQAFLAPITKATFTVPSVAALPDLLRSAFRIATAPRPGPVALIIPHDVMDAEWDEEEIPVDPRTVRAPSFRYRPEDSDLDRAAELLTRARRPAIVAGGGVHGSDAADLFTAFCDTHRPLVVTSLSGKGAVPETRPYAAGVLNPLGSAAALELIKEADLVFWCGSKASQNTALNWTLPTAEQATITLDADPLEHGRTFLPTVALCGDVRATLQALDERLRGADTDRPDWSARIAAVMETHRARIADEIAGDSSPLLPQRVMAEVARHLSPDDVVVSDASWSAGWIASYIPATVPGRRFLYARGQGGLGYAVPAAIGAGALAKDRGTRVVTVAGDGAHCYAIGEMASLVQQNYPVVNIVLNNGTLGWLQMWQELFFGNLRQSVDLSFGDKPHYGDAATALGLKGFRVRTP
ncbi:MAG: thiamine pyrophosphate-binding protein, partial [Gluconacetobacter diazotrophicus]|nr:thiamine pyrophosphate-binding protein [Gluconacetobacter diazotrophicus]